MNQHQRTHPVARRRARLIALCALMMPSLAAAQASPFLTGATALESNILAWLTPVAVILVMVLGAMAMANRIAQVAAIYGTGDAQTIIENCGNTLILRCSASERGGTAQFCSRLIGEREVVRRTISRGRDSPGGFGSASRGARRSEHLSAQRVIELAVLPSEIEQLPDFSGYLKTAGSAYWLKVRVRQARSRRW